MHSPQARTVLFDHDGGIDDLLSLMMLLAMPHIKLAGIVVTPADCFLRPAVSATLKILRLFGQTNIEVSAGALHGANPFPRAWRKQAYAVDALPILNDLNMVDNSFKSAQKSSSIPNQPDIIYRMPARHLTQGQDLFEELKQRLRDKVLADLNRNLFYENADAVRPAVENLFDQALSQENIILSRTERSRLFEAIFSNLIGLFVLPAPVSEPGHEFLAGKLQEAREPVTVLVTGPVTNLAYVLDKQPELAAKIDEVVWMGGALNVEGNVRDYEHDGSAEWNAYWDPPAVQCLWQSQAPITLFPLDATNKVPVTKEFLHRLAQQRRYPLSDLAGQCWAMTVGAIPAYEYLYYMWDTLTTGYLGAPQFISFRQAQSKVISSGPSAGRIKEAAEGGKSIKAAAKVDVEGFLNYVLTLFQQ
jgi:inosine-uridine nucleoside N-ribohydrolase